MKICLKENVSNFQKRKLIFDKIFHYTKKVLLKNPDFMFLIT